LVGREEDERPLGSSAVGWFAVEVNEVLKMVSVEVVSLDDGLLDVWRESASMRVIGGKVSGGEGCVVRIGVKVNSTWANSVRDDCGEVVRFTRVGIHLCLLGDVCSMKFLLGTNGRNFDRRLMWGKLGRVIDVCLPNCFGGRGDERAGFAIFTKRGVEDDLWSKFMDREGCKDVLNGVVTLAEGNEMLEESSGGKCCDWWEGCEAVVKGGEG